MNRGNKKMSISGLIKNKEIEFYSRTGKLDTKMDDFGEYDWNLVRHLAKQSNEIKITGTGLESFLENPANLGELTEFLVQLSSVSVGGKYHVEADIEKINQSYPKEKIIIGNFLGTIRQDTDFWAPYMSQFEKLWNFAVCGSIGGFVGYPGYEWPQNGEQFEICVAENAKQFLIGTKEQLSRYDIYTKKLADHCPELKDTLDYFKNFKTGGN